MALTAQQTTMIMATMSPARMGTYISAKGFSINATALDIYVWNAKVSGAFFSALQVCEVVIRNSVSHALELKYGCNWPWEPNFERTLSKWYKDELIQARRGIPIGSTGKVIAELTFGFWCKMFTAGQDQHIWNAYLHTVFPFIPLPLTVPSARKMLYENMEALRLFRNRIAHHEPIIGYPLAQLQRRIERLIMLRCQETSGWLDQWEMMSALLAAPP
jgi:hypothetical protein